VDSPETPSRGHTVPRRVHVPYVVRPSFLTAGRHRAGHVRARRSRAKLSPVDPRRSSPSRGRGMGQPIPDGNYIHEHAAPAGEGARARRPRQDCLPFKRCITDALHCSELRHRLLGRLDTAEFTGRSRMEAVERLVRWARFEEHASDPCECLLLASAHSRAQTPRLSTASVPVSHFIRRTFSFEEQCPSPGAPSCWKVYG
jgi:hypothetical protein